MQNYYIRKILSKENLKEVDNILKQADENNSWIDGLSSTINMTKETKNNLELSDLSLTTPINDCIMNSLDNDKEFLDFTVPLSTNLNIISKTMEGGYYNPHKDKWYNGDFSTTVFLNDPSEYDGGELCLYFGGEEEIKIKLDAGWGITYSTGIIHRVNKVKCGYRYVSVFWTKSLIKDDFIRFIYSELGDIQNNIKHLNQPIYNKNCHTSKSDPLFCIQNVQEHILRKYGKN